MEIDWPGIRAAALVLGVREAARQASADLSALEQTRFVNRVMQRSHREGWITRASALRKTIKPAGKPLSAPVSSGSDALATSSKQTRILLSKTTLKAARQFVSKTGQQIIDKAKALRDVTAAAAQIGAWSDGRQGPLVSLKLLSIGGKLELQAGETREDTPEA